MGLDVEDIVGLEVEVGRLEEGFRFEVDAAVAAEAFLLADDQDIIAVGE